MSQSRPNVLIVLVDDQGYGDLECHGHPVLKTPALNRLWSESVRLTDFHVAPMCTPTRGSLLTGLDPLRHGAVNVSSGRTLLRPDVVTLPELLQRGGYRTGLFGKWHLGDNFPYRPQDRGFQRASWFPSSHVTSAPDRWENDYFDMWLRDQAGSVTQTRGYCTDVLFDLTARWIGDRADEAEPFFALVSLNAVHRPLLVPDEYRSPYRNLDRELATYCGMIANIDENMDRVGAMLDGRGLLDNTLLVYVTDNGADAPMAAFYNAGMRGHKATLWEGGHRVPFFARWPAGGIGGVGRGRDVDELVIVQDILPTVADLCGVGSPAGLDGRNVAGLLTGQAETLETRSAVVQYSRMSHPEPTKGDAAVLRGKWRLLLNGGHPAAPAPAAELYDVSADPGQQKDVAGEHPLVVTDLQDDYERWWQGVKAHVSRFGDIAIGAEEENPTLLSPADWHDVFLDQQEQIRAGLRRRGTWSVEVRRGGVYHIELRRWPVESGLSLDAPAPPFAGGDCVYPAGAALPIRRAHLQVGQIECHQDLSGRELGAAFVVELEQGSTTMDAWFDDQDGLPIAGAYYVYVSWRPNRKQRR